MKTLCDNSNDGPAVQKRHAKVPAKQRAKPANITRRHRLVSPPVCRNLSPLRLRHRSDSHNILLHWVYWRDAHQGKRQYTDCQEQCNDSYAVFEKQRHKPPSRIFHHSLPCRPSRLQQISDTCVISTATCADSAKAAWRHRADGAAACQCQARRAHNTDGPH